MRSTLFLIILGLLLYIVWPKSEPPLSPSVPALPFRELQSVYNLTLAANGFDPSVKSREVVGAIEEKVYSAKATIAAFVKVNPSAEEACKPALDLCSEIISMIEKRRALTMRLDSLRMKVAPALLARTTQERQRIEQGRLDDLQSPTLYQWASEVEAFKMRARKLAEKMKINEAMWATNRTGANR